MLPESGIKTSTFGVHLLKFDLNFHFPFELELLLIILLQGLMILISGQKEPHNYMYFKNSPIALNFHNLFPLISMIPQKSYFINSMKGCISIIMSEICPMIFCCAFCVSSFSFRLCL